MNLQIFVAVAEIVSALAVTRFGDAIDYAKHCSRSHRAVIRVCDKAGDVIETHEHKGDFNAAG